MMGRSSRMIFDGFLRYSSKITLSRHTFSSSPNLGETTILNLQKGVKSKQRKIPFIDGANKFYSTDSSNQIGELKASRGWRRWVWNLETAAALTLFGGLFAFDFYKGSWETMPYTRRRQFLLFPPSFDETGAVNYGEMMKVLNRNLVAPFHPDSVRVRKIARDLIEAFRRKEGDDRVRKRWEIVVFNIPIRHTISYPAGKIIVFSGLLNSCAEDAELAAFIALEVVRALARHDVEKISIRELLTNLFLLILHVFVTSTPSLFKHLSFPFSRSLVYGVTWIAVSRLIQRFYSLVMDLEADYIGLLLVASAGYDPRVAFLAREKMGRMSGGSRWERMRARLLVLDMEEALSIYREVTVGKDA